MKNIFITLNSRDAKNVSFALNAALRECHFYLDCGGDDDLEATARYMREAAQEARYLEALAEAVTDTLTVYDARKLARLIGKTPRCAFGDEEGQGWALEAIDALNEMSATAARLNRIPQVEPEPFDPTVGGKYRLKEDCTKPGQRYYEARRVNDVPYYGECPPYDPPPLSKLKGVVRVPEGEGWNVPTFVVPNADQPPSLDGHVVEGA